MFEIINQLGAISQFFCGKSGGRKVGALVNYRCGYFFFFIDSAKKVHNFSFYEFHEASEFLKYFLDSLGIAEYFPTTV